MTMEHGRIGYPNLNRPDFWPDVYPKNGVEPPWLQNWKDGKVVPRGEGGQLDVQVVAPRGHRGR
jgi:hypothetical protein